LRYAILSDIHGNFEALQAVLERLEDEGIDSYVCLGDIVGYGPEPARCLHEIRRYADLIIAGNHDFAVADKISVAGFNVFAKEAILWTRQQLDDSDVAFLGGLPMLEERDGFEVVHGTPYAPELFDYLQTSYDACISMEAMEGRLCFVGHSHIPVTFVEKEVVCYCLAGEVKVEGENRVIVNVGSVGQPRDRDARACYAVYDSGSATVSLRRVRYDVEATVVKVRESGLPGALGERLRVGR
jgi:predicted phosphodiesterase